MSPTKKIDPLVIAISSRALFDLSDSHRVFMEDTVDENHRHNKMSASHRSLSLSENNRFE